MPAETFGIRALTPGSRVEVDYTPALWPGNFAVVPLLTLVLAHGFLLDKRT
jgi:hypothetical protein